jgi:hypothetical protein
VEDDHTLIRIAENQSRFREANEQIEVAAERMTLLGPIPFICECPREDCMELVQMNLDAYEEVRQHPQRFFTAAGHQDVSIEAGAGMLVAQREGYVVVDKIGIAGEKARDEYRQLAE